MFRIRLFGLYHGSNFCRKSDKIEHFFLQLNEPINVCKPFADKLLISFSGTAIYIYNSSIFKLAADDGDADADEGDAEPL